MTEVKKEVKKRRRPRYRYVHEFGELFRFGPIGYKALLKDIASGEFVSLHTYGEKYGEMIAEHIIHFEDLQAGKTAKEIARGYIKAREWCRGGVL